ncbi:unnamed protein product [Clavelina lepadiformis]|uniref:Uncharacterized protein n=1 Tax=Clavelina lepadiformis TaxID=159417 RepID=A0ABP0FHN6_CLALP
MMLKIIAMLLLAACRMTTVNGDATGLYCHVGETIVSAMNITVEASNEMVSESCGGTDFVCGSYLYFNKTRNDTVFVLSGRCISRNDTKYQGCGFLQQNTASSWIYGCEYYQCEHRDNCNSGLLENYSYLYFPAYCSWGNRVFNENKTLPISNNLSESNGNKCQIGDVCGTFQYFNHTDNGTFFVQQAQCIPGHRIPYEWNCASLREEDRSSSGEVGYCKFQSCVGESYRCNNVDLEFGRRTCLAPEEDDFPLLPGCTAATAWNSVLNCFKEEFGDALNSSDICRLMPDSRDFNALERCIGRSVSECILPACPSVLGTHPRLTELFRVLEIISDPSWDFTENILQETTIDIKPYTREICEFFLTDVDQILVLFDDVCDDTIIDDLNKWGVEVIATIQNATNYPDIRQAFEMFDAQLQNATKTRCNLDRISEVFEPILPGFSYFIENIVKLFVEAEPTFGVLMNECKIIAQC